MCARSYTNSGANTGMWFFQYKDPHSYIKIPTFLENLKFTFISETYKNLSCVNAFNQIHPNCTFSLIELHEIERKFECIINNILFFVILLNITSINCSISRLYLQKQFIIQSYLFLS